LIRCIIETIHHRNDAPKRGAKERALTSSLTSGVILFGHGARDPQWAEPMRQLAALVRAARGAGPVTLAFLELMQPDLPAAIAEQAGLGCRMITVIPVFLGQGGHVRRDLPAVIERCRSAWPEVEIRCTETVGENAAVLAAIAQFCIDRAD
jgi:sirohydrochlorin cobaltochelatase